MIDPELGWRGLPSQGRAALASQRFDEARQIIHEAQARKLDDYPLHNALYALAFLGADSAAMAEQQQWFADTPKYEHFGLALASDTELFPVENRYVAIVSGFFSTVLYIRPASRKLNVAPVRKGTTSPPPAPAPGRALNWKDSDNVVVIGPSPIWQTEVRPRSELHAWPKTSKSSGRRRCWHAVVLGFLLAKGTRRYPDPAGAGSASCSAPLKTRHMGPCLK